MSYKIPDCVPIFNLKKLVSEMIASAVEEYRLFESRGQIVGGKVMREHFHQFNKNVKIQDARDVVHFFSHGVVDEWISLSGLDISPQMIRSKIGLL